MIGRNPNPIHSRPARSKPFKRLRQTSGDLQIDTLTHVELTWRSKRVEHRIRFGHPIASIRLDRHCRRVSFAPGSIFCVVQWVANDYGTILSRVDILRAVGAGERCVTAPLVQPGAAILLSMSGWPKVERVLQAIDGVQALGLNPADAAPEHWHHVHNRISVRESPRSYTLTQHRAWLKRRRLMP